MRVVTQDFESGKLSVSEAPEPTLRAGGVLVRTDASLVSVGTERAVVSLARKGPIGKALDRPDLARQVINKALTDGVWSTYKMVKNLLREPLPLGYSLVGRVIGVGAGVHGVALGDRVACAGLGYANHAETVFVPQNLFCPVPDAVPDEQAAYATLGAIALHGVRQADQQIGANVIVVGLGLVGQIALQIARAAGYRVIGVDPDPRKTALAVERGAGGAFAPDDPGLAEAVAAATDGQGADCALLAAAARDDGEIFDRVADLCRDRGRIVAIGDVKMHMTRRKFFEKELEVFQSRSYGPGRYDTEYEEKGHDYPIAYVRWTENRNLRAFLGLIEDGCIDMAALTTHRFDIAEAERAYEVVTGDDDALRLGILLNYPADAEAAAAPAPAAPKAGTKSASGRIRLGVIGSGRFARAILLPAFMGNGRFEMRGVASAKGLTAESVRRKYRADYAASDASSVLGDPDVDAVIIATRPDSHAAYVVDALKAGKHVFVEKPLCLNREELAAIAAAAEASTGILTVGYNRRFSPLVADMKEHFAGRREPLAMMYRANPGRIPLAGADGWVHEASLGGGRIVGEACHFIDTLQALCGANPVAVSAQALNPGREGLASTDVVTISLTFDDGSIGTVHYWSNGDRRYPKERMEVYCQEQIAVLDNFRRLELAARGRTKTRRLLNQKKGFAEEALAFAEACQSGEPPIALDSLLATSTATFLATEDLMGQLTG